MIFPVFSSEQNKLTSLKGEVGYFFKVESIDMEMLRDKEAFYSDVQAKLLSLESKEIYRFYELEGMTYLYTSNKKPNLEGMKLVSQNNPLEIFFEENTHSSIDFYEDYFVSGERYGRILSVSEFPELAKANELNQFGNFVLSFRKIDPVKSVGKLKFKRRIHFSGLFQGIRNIESEESFKEADTLLEKITKWQDALFEVEVFFILKASNKTLLDEKTESLIKKAKVKGLLLRTESLALTYFFANAVVGVVPTFKRKHLVPASFLKCLIPFSGERFMDKGMSFLSKSGKKLQFTLFNPASINFNALFTGETGQGKSMLVNKVLREEVQNGAGAVILDSKGSYLKNVRFQGGKCIEGRINPLSFPDPIFLKEFILAHIPNGMDQKDQGKMIVKIKEELPSISSFKGLIDRLSFSFSDLNFYFEESWDHFSCEDFVLNPISYLDFEKFPEKLKTPLIIYLMESFKRLKGKKIIVMDECWELLINHARFVEKNFRELRKLDGSAIAIGQNLNDFTSTALGKVVAQNTFYKFFLKQNLSPSEFVDSHQVKQIAELKTIKRVYSEAFLISESFEKVMRFNPTPLEYELFTTAGEDQPLYEGYMEEAGRFLPFTKAMENFVKIKHGERL